jgi:hypothetical protein
MNTNLQPTQGNAFAFAVQELQKVKTVQMWNYVREEVKNLLTFSELHRIDTEGLIVQTLGADYVPVPRQRNCFECGGENGQHDQYCSYVAPSLNSVL